MPSLKQDLYIHTQKAPTPLELSCLDLSGQTSSHYALFLLAALPHSSTTELLATLKYGLSTDPVSTTSSLLSSYHHSLSRLLSHFFQHLMVTGRAGKARPRSPSILPFTLQWLCFRYTIGRLGRGFPCCTSLGEGVLCVREERDSGEVWFV